MRLEYGWHHSRKRCPENARTLKRVSCELNLCRWRCSWVFRISTDRDLRHLKMRRAWDAVNIVRIVPLLVSKKQSQMLLNAFVREATEPACVFAYVFRVPLLLRSSWLYNTRRYQVLFLNLWYDSTWCNVTPLAPKHTSIILLTIHFLAGDQQVVPRGVTHISCHNKNTIEGTGENKTNEQTGQTICLGLTKSRRSYATLHFR